MTRDEAVARIQDGLGFAERQSDKIILRLQEAQRDLEQGKTLPKFLLRENQELTTALLANEIALPSDYLRFSDDYTPFYFSSGFKVNKLKVYKDFYGTFDRSWNGLRATPPAIFTIRNNVINLINPADGVYTIFWEYYGKAALLTSNIENDWLENASDWLIGLAGERMARDVRDKDGMAIFSTLKTEGRAACFGEILADEDDMGPTQMGINL